MPMEINWKIAFDLASRQAGVLHRPLSQRFELFQNKGKNPSVSGCEEFSAGSTFTL
jgi:hypothetical protein